MGGLLSPVSLVFRLFIAEITTNNLDDLVLLITWSLPFLKANLLSFFANSNQTETSGSA